MADRVSDEKLLENYRQGDADAFRTLIERHQNDLMRFLRRLMGENQAAEDVFQDTFLQIHISAGQFDTSRRFKPWLFTIAANKGRDYLRKKNRRRTVDLSAPVQGGSGGNDSTAFVDLMEVQIDPPGAALDDKEREQLVEQALQKLPYPYREILLLAYFQRLSYAQVAEDLQIPLGTVKSRLHSAVAAFARQWNRVSKEDSAS